MSGGAGEGITVRVPSARQGQTGMGQGGYTCHQLHRAVGELGGPASITTALRRPIPLETDLVVRPAPLRDGTDGWVMINPAAPEQPLLEAAPWESVVPDTAAVSIDEAEEARARHVMAPGDHPAPRCLSCGLGPDSLRVHAGPLDDGRYATPLRLPVDPGTGGVDDSLVWMAIDCACGWFTSRSGASPGSGVTVQYGVEVLAPFEPETDYALVAWHGAGPVDWDGRKRTSAAAVFAADGTVMARSQSLWVRPSAAN